MKRCCGVWKGFERPSSCADDNNNHNNNHRSTSNNKSNYSHRLAWSVVKLSAFDACSARPISSLSAPTAVLSMAWSSLCTACKGVKFINW